MDEMQHQSNNFVEIMLKHERKTRELIFEEGDVGSIPKTKISGMPWWPNGIQRPKCRKGHNMSFIVQVFLPDVPNLNGYENTILSFHYCDECIKKGNMSFGWNDNENKGYDISIFESVNTKEIDDIGLLQESILKPYGVSFRDIMDVPGDYEDAGINYNEVPKDYPQSKDDFDENVYPNLTHISKSKLGGWPTWVQSAEWPEPKANSTFVCQLDWRTFDGSPWAIGGYAYIFLKEINNSIKGELCIQMT